MNDGTKNCGDYGELLSAYLDDELGPLELRELGLHLRSCARCAGELDRLMEVKTLLRRAEPFWPRQEVSEGFAAAVTRRLATEAPVPPRMAGRRLGALGAGLLATVLLAAGLFVLARQWSPGGTTTPLAGSPDPAAGVLLAKGDAGDDVRRYLQEHVMESSRAILVEPQDAVELVGDGLP